MAITNQQKRRYMAERNQGQSQIVSAAKAGFSERTGRALEKGQCQTSKGSPRSWRTRHDPFSEVWNKDCLPFLERNPDCQALTLLEILQEKYPEQFADSLLRTLQRRVNQWKALYGPEKEVFFRQNHPPGEMGLSDFTKIKSFQILIAGKEFSHLLYHFRLAYSGFCFVKIVQGGESYTALTEGLQSALQLLGGVPKIHRTDRLSAAYKNLSASEKEDMTLHYEAFCEHYSMKPSRNNLGKSHENGSIESPHGHFKRALKQALLKRGSNEFDSIEAYSEFLNKLTAKSNQKREQKIIEEKAYLQRLPREKAVDYTGLTVKVTSSSTINVRLIVYSVPSRLIGSTLKVHLYDDRLELFKGRDFVTSLERAYPEKGSRRGRKIDYRHMIPSLKKKSGAFYGSQLRNDLFPSESYKKLWELAESLMIPAQASRWMVGVLDVVTKTQKVEEVASILLKNYEEKQELMELVRLEEEFKTVPKATANINATQHLLSSYNELLRGE